MNEIAGNTPVIIGVGQYAERVGEPGYGALSPMDIAGQALRAAVADCRASGDVPAAIDTIAAIRQFEISYASAQAPFGKADNPPRAIARRIGADPARAILEHTGGQGPQKLVGELAEAIAAGTSDCAVVAGSEAFSTMLSLLKSGETADWAEEIGGSIEDRPYALEGLIDPAAMANGLNSPIPLYALFENARRAHLGASLEDYRLRMGELFAPFTQVAAANPYAAAPTARSAEQLAQVTERNRIVAEPFPRMVIARDQVNQGAAIILASAAKARELGVPEDRWVHIHASADAKEAPALTRADLAKSPASIASAETALDIAGRTMADIAYIDFYSCFPIAVFNQTDHFGLASDDPRGFTLTGGLPYFGGAGNNYSAHAIAEAVGRLRANRGSAALVGANGGYLSKYSTGIYSTQPADWSRSRRLSLPDACASVEVPTMFDGRAVIESFTMMPGKDGGKAMVAARTYEGARIAAVAAPGDKDTIAAINEREPIGREIAVTSADKGRNHFTFA